MAFERAVSPSRRAASAGARKPLPSYPRFGRVNGIARPFKGRESNYVISWLRYAEEAVAILDDGVSNRNDGGWRRRIREGCRRLKVKRNRTDGTPERTFSDKAIRGGAEK